MPTTRRSASKLISSALALALAFVGPLCQAGPVVTGRVVQTPVIGAAGMAGAQVYQVKLPELSLKGATLATTPASLTPTVAPLPTAVLQTPSLKEARPSQAQAALLSLETAALPSVQTPVFDVLNKLEAAGVDLQGGGTPADAAKLIAAAETLPAGAARDNLVMMAKAIVAPKGETDAAIAKAYDNSQPADAPVAVEASGGLWTTLSKVKLFPRSLRQKFATRAEKNRLKAQPRDAKQYEVPIEKLRWSPAADQLPESTKDLKVSDDRIVGQERALKALSFGLRMPGDRYNVFVAGLEGSGRETAVRHVLEKLAPTMPTPRDVVAVTNFESPDIPATLLLPAGAAPGFQAAVADFVAKMQAVLPQVLQSSDMAKVRKMLEAKLRQMAQARQSALDAEIAKVRVGKFGIAISAEEREGGYALIVAPTLDGKALTPEALQEKIASGQITQEEWEKAQAEASAAAEPFVEKYKEMMAQNAEDQAGASKKLEMLQMQAAASLAGQLGEDVKQAALGGKVDNAAIEAIQKKMEMMRAIFAKEVAELKIGRFGAIIDAVPGSDGSMRIAIGLTLDGQPLTQEVLEANGIGMDEVKAAQAELKKAAKPYVEKLKAMMEGFQKEYEDAAAAQTAKPKTKEDRMALAYVDMMVGNAARHYEDFLPKQPAGGLMGMLGGAPEQTDPRENYKVNVIATNKAESGAPVVYERAPSYERLFGAVETQAMMVPGVGVVKKKSPGGPTMRSGSFLRANGGFLVLNAMDVLRSPGAWEGLMRAIRNGRAVIAEEGGGVGYAMPSKVKVVLLGSPMIKMLLREHDEDFNGNFNASVEFQSVLDITKETLDGFLAFMKKMVVGGAGQVLDMTKGAISAIMEFSARLAGSNERLSAQFGALLSVMREATFWAKESGRDQVTRDDVRAALRAREEREGGSKARLHEIFRKGVFRVDVSGSQVGQINGLAVMGNFGVPARVTVVSSPGRGIISVDRDAGQTGPSYNKALGVVEGFLEHTFARRKALSAHFRISFEQNYGGIDGDSATSTEIYAILSSLSGVPIQQRFAVTGSADQFGNVQAIGGANEKTEGFFSVASGMANKAYKDGMNGVIMPATNVGDLMLSEEVVQAVKDGRFKIYAVKHVSEGIEILTGEAYTEILRKAQSRLDEFAENAPAVVIQR